MNDTIYVVSSFHRSGSAMMMRCLEAGGLEVIVDKDMDSLLNSWFANDGYAPNPNGFYQAPDSIWLKEDFVEMAKGKAIKIYVENLAELPPANYKIIFMKRDPEEIRTSMRTMTQTINTADEQRLDGYEGKILQMVQDMNGKNAEVFILNYADVVNNPQKEFSKLTGFPIDIEKASEMVEPSLYRFKLERT